MATKTVAIRLGTEGKAQVKADFDEIGASGDASAKRWSRAYERAGEDVNAALARQAAAASKLSLIQPQSAMQMQVQAAAGSNTRFGGGYAASSGNRAGSYEGTARQSAAAFKELIAAEEQMEARARSLLATIDPLWAAQNRYNAEIKEAKTLLDAGKLSAEQYAAAERLSKAALDETAESARRGGQSLGAVKAGYQQLSFQIGDVASQMTSVGSAGDVVRILSQQASQFVGALALITGDGGNGGAAGASSAVADMTDTLSGANDSFDAVTGASERLTTVLGTNSASAGANSAASETNAVAHGTQAAATGVATVATGTNTAATGVNTAATEANAVATNTLAAAKTRLIAFMAGPWGAVALGGVTLLAMLASKYFESGEAADETTATLAAQVGTVEALDAANKLLNDTLGQSIQNQGQVRAAAIGIANANLAAADAAHARAVEEIGLARAMLAQREARSRQGGERSDVAAMGLSGDADKIDALEAKLTASEGKTAELRRNRNALVAEDMRIRAGEAADRADNDAKLLAATRATGAAERSLAEIRKQGRIELAAGTLTEEAYRARVVAGEKALETAREADRKHGNGRAISLARQADAMEVNAAAALDLARAYLVGGDAALRAEAARKGLTDATKKGIDGDAQVQRQLAVMVGEQLANGAKSVAQLRDETAARATLNAAVAAGTLPVGELNQALQDETALRPLLKLQTLAQGDALALLTRIIGEYRTAMADARAEEAKSAAASAIDATKSRAAEIRASILDLSKSPEEQAMAAARRAAEREAKAGGFNPGDRQRLIDQRVAEAQADARAKMASYLVDTRAAQEDGVALAQRELDLVAANDNVRAAELEKLKIVLDLRRRFPEMAEQDVAALLAGVDTLAAMEAELGRTAAAMDELRGFGTEFVDTVLSEKTWESWGNGGRAILGMLKAEFVKLALLNPLRNLINGDSALPTLGSAIGSIGKLFGGAAAAPAVLNAAGGLAGTSSFLPKLAAGTEYWSGGEALVGEGGAERVYLPTGARVVSAGETRRQLAANDGAPAISMPVTINAPGADAAALARVEDSIEQLRRDVPGMAVGAYREAAARGGMRR